MIPEKEVVRQLSRETSPEREVVYGRFARQGSGSVGGGGEGCWPPEMWPARWVIHGAAELECQ
eukprot:233836-Chlamydomonas_euryale.AAC.3